MQAKATAEAACAHTHEVRSGESWKLRNFVRKTEIEEK